DRERSMEVGQSDHGGRGERKGNHQDDDGTARDAPGLHRRCNLVTRRHPTSSSVLPHDRASRTSAITPKMRKLADSGIKARPNVSDTPISRLAQNAPAMLPRPPTTTTISVVISTSKSRPG